MLEFLLLILKFVLMVGGVACLFWLCDWFENNHSWNAVAKRRHEEACKRWDEIRKREYDEDSN